MINLCTGEVNFELWLAVICFWMSLWDSTWLYFTAVTLGAEFYYLPMWFCSQVMLEKCCWTRNSCSDYICIQTIFWGWDRVWSTCEYKCIIIWCSHPRHSSCKNILFSHWYISCVFYVVLTYKNSCTINCSNCTVSYFWKISLNIFS